MSTATKTAAGYLIEASGAEADPVKLETAVIEGLYHRLGLPIDEIENLSVPGSWRGRIEAPAGISTSVLTEAIEAELKALGKTSVRLQITPVSV